MLAHIRPDGRRPASATSMTTAPSDIAWYNSTTGNIDIWQIVNGHWNGSVDVGSHPLGWAPAGIGDFNGDGTERHRVAQFGDRQR